jgi:filamentous hemagglutinin family protein
LPKKAILAAAVALALGVRIFEAEAQSISGTALPTGGNIVGGQASISQSGAAMRIEQASSRAAIDWQSFNIGAQASVTFDQPSANAIALNRVLGASGSEIFGRLSANGQVFLVNPNGILFGRGAQVDVGGLVASTLGMSPHDFMSGRYVLRGQGTPGAIVNQASIRAPRGSVALIAPSIVNDGLIEAQYGAVSLAAANAATVDFIADGLVQIRVDEGALQAEIANSGVLRADGGSVTLTAKALDSLASAVINNAGIIEARTVENVNGVVRLAGGDVNVSGTIDVSAPEGTGGSVHVLGERVALVGRARLDASGAHGGGEVLIGGDFQGKNAEILNAKRTYVGPDAIIDASATQSGDGGRVIVWSDEKTGFYGTINARGGASGGDGGFVETSSKGALDVRNSTVDTTAPMGSIGNWLLDPKFIVVAIGGLVPLLDVDQFFDNQDGTSVIDPLAINAALSDVTLQASTDVTFQNAVSMLNSGVKLTAQAGRSIRINADIRTNNADVTLIANDSAADPLFRDAGPGGIAMADGTTISASTGKATLKVDVGFPDADRDDIVAANINAANIELQQNSPSPGSSILRTATSLLSGTNLFLEVDHSGNASGGSIGTASAPMLVKVTNLEAHTHEASPGIFIVSPNQDLTIGGVSFYGGAEKGVQAITSGDISISVNGTLTTEAGSPTCAAGTGGPICSGGGTVTLQAENMVLGNSVTATSGTVLLQPFSTSRDIRIESGDSGGRLSLTPSELMLISANVVKIGRTSDTGRLRLDTGISSANLNAGSLALTHQNVEINQPVDFSAQNETLSLAHGTGGSITIGADVDVGSGKISAGGQTVNISGSPTVLTSTNPGVGFSAGILNVNGGADLSLGATSIIDTLNISNGTLRGTGNATVTSAFNWTGGMVTGAGALMTKGMSMLSSPSSHQLSGRAWTNAGTAQLSAGWLSLNDGATLNNASGGTFEVTALGTGPINSNAVGANRLNNAGTFNWNRASTGSISAISAFNNSGQLNVQSGTLNMSSPFTQTGSLEVAAGATFTKSGGFVNSGMLYGAGTVNVGAGTLTNDGTVAPGGVGTVGTLSVNGDFIQGATGSLHIDLGSEDVLAVSGSTSLDGILNVNHMPSFSANVGSVFTPITYASVSGDFTTKNFPAGAGYSTQITATSYQLTLNSLTAPPIVAPPPGVSPPLPNTTTTVSATTGFEPSTVATADMTGAGATISSETSSNSSLVALSVRPDFVLPDISHLIAAMSELRKKKVDAVENAARILERDPAAADLPACAGEVSGNCIAERPARRGLRDGSDRAAPELAHLWGIERKIALLIGVDEYPDPIPRLGSPLKDIAEIGRLYAQHFGYEVRTLANPDKASIVREINRLILETRLNDSVVVFYAGHGHVVEKTGRGYWIPGRASGDEPTQWISNSDIAKMLANIPARQVLLVSDSCFSGTLTREGKVEKSEVLPDPRAVLELRSVTVLSSGGEEPVADAGKDGHSVFAWHFLRTLGRVAQWSNGVDIYERLAEVVQLDFPQQPQYGAALGAGHEPGADFLFEVRRY